MHAAAWYTGMDKATLSTPFDAAAWETLLSARDAINKTLESARAAGTIGAGLEAAVTVYADASVYPVLKQLGKELSFFCITSEAVVLPLADKPNAVPLSAELPKIAIVVTALTYPKCVRCWHRRVDVNTIPTHPDICPRCVDNIVGPGEVRQYA